MQRKHIFYIIISIFLIFVLFSFCKFCYKLIDEINLRNQFHVPLQVKIVSLESNPKTPGLFGRNGLQIEAVFQFNDKQFNDYLNGLNNKTIWTPVPFIDYSPDRAENYSPLAFQWLDWPILPSSQNNFDKYPDAFFYEKLKSYKGKYYYFVLASSTGRKIEHGDGNYHYEWKFIGLHDSELPTPPPPESFPTKLESSQISPWPEIQTLGVLVYDTKKLYCLIKFHFQG